MAQRFALRRSLLAATTASAALSVLAFAAEARAATTRKVPSQYASISAAVTAAVAGDTILVDDGTYGGATNTDLSINAAITIQSVNGPAKTIIDASFDFFLAANVGIKLEGFTIENSTFSAPVELRANSTVSNCIFKNNTSEEDEGAAIEVFGGTATVDSCTFSGNQGIGAIQASGGSLVITGSTFEDNTGSDGAGAIDFNTGTVTITGSTFTGNKSSSNGQGGVMYLRNGAVTIDGCTFTNNSSGVGGGVLLAAAEGANTPVTITRSTFSGNHSPSGGVFYLTESEDTTSLSVTDSVFLGNTSTGGGGVLIAAGSAPSSSSFQNCSFYGNDATGSATSADFGGNAASTLSLTNCVLHGDLSPVIVSTASPFKKATVTSCDIPQAAYTGSNGNLDADPGYAGAASGDLHIGPSSPCAGTGTSTGAPAADFDGRAWGAKVSIGAFAPVAPAADAGSDAGTDGGAGADAALLADAAADATDDAAGDDGGSAGADDAAADATGDEAPVAEEDASTEPVSDASTGAPGATGDAGAAPARASSGCSCHAASGTGGGAGALFGAVALMGMCIRRRGARGTRTGERVTRTG